MPDQMIEPAAREKIRAIAKERNRIASMLTRDGHEKYLKDKAELELCGLENEFMAWAVARYA